MARLWIMGGPNPIQFELTDVSVTVGRLSSNDIQLKDGSVSKTHARIQPSTKTQGWKIDDLGSSNGTYVNDNQITSQELTAGARIRCGNTEMILDDSMLVDDDINNIEDMEESSPSIYTSIPVLEPGALEEALRSGESDRSSKTKVASATKEHPSDRKLKLIQLIGEKLIKTTDSHELADEIMSIVVRQTKADRGFLCIFNQKGEHIPLATHGLKQGDQMRISRTVLKRLLEEKSGILIKKIAVEDQAFESLKAMNVASTLCIPLWTTDKIMGFISLDRTGRSGSFTKSHLELMLAVAHQAAIGIERARLARKAEQEYSVRSYLSKYLDEKLVQHIVDSKSSGGRDPLAPTEREVTVLFSDIVSFTKISEGLKPSELADFIYDYLTAMTEIIFAHGGTIDKYIGDAVMALFGAPIPSDSAPSSAIRAALQMADYVEQMPVPAAVKDPLRVRFGISTGNAVVGNIGSAQRAEYTAIGDTVNIASRLESFGRPQEICIDQATRDAAEKEFTMQGIGSIDVKNRAQPVSVFQVLSEKRKRKPIVDTKQLKEPIHPPET